jgi:predicted RNA-binding Zn-ribbon protein involved in translation (DUF1610 family)/DNA-directed RNA polymerase subunit RPC12/RpoP
MDEKTVSSYVCPNCGGTLKFNIKQQKFACASCGTESEIKPQKDFVEEYPIETCEERENDGEIFEGMESVVCKNCGSEIVFGDNQTAKVCPMCGSTQILASKQSAGISPDGIIPFKIDNKDAQEKFRVWVKKRWFAPNKLKTAYQSGRLTGMYIPFWTYDFDVSASYRGAGGTIRTERDRDGKTHTRTDWTNVYGNVSRSFDDVPVCATSSDVSQVVDKILPYSTSEGSLPYDAAYLSGFGAEHYTLKCPDGLKIAKKTAESQMRNDAEDDIRRMGYDSARVDSINCTYDNTRYKHVMLPAWVSSFTYNGKSYKYIINGETGKVGGERPYSAIKIAIAVVLAALAILLLFTMCSGDADAMEIGTYETQTIQSVDDNIIQDNIIQYEINKNYEEEYGYGMVRTR